MAPLGFSALRRTNTRASRSGAGTPRGAAAPVERGRAASSTSDGLWTPAPTEVERAWSAASVLLEAVGSRGPRDFGELSPGERYAVGVGLAGRWTLGLQAAAPLTGDETPLTAESVARELSVAELLVSAQRPDWEAAAGVRAWLSWLTGGAERMVFRPL